MHQETKGGENSNSIKREMEKVINGHISHNDSEPLPHLRETSSQENEIRDIDTRNEAPRQGKNIRINGYFINLNV